MAGKRSDILDAIREKIAMAPTSPGVYFFKDSAGVVLYVGKAKNLKLRAASYFHISADLSKTRNERIANMIDTHVCDVDFLQCDSEVDALLRESRLIKDIHPRYNAAMKDGKTFPYLQITAREDFPIVTITRQPLLRGVKLFGPFISVNDLRAAIPLLQRVFKFRTCNLELHAGSIKPGQFRPCLLKNIKQCSAPCSGKVSKEAYADQIKHFKQFLASKGSQLKKDIKLKMAAAAKNLQFELAAQYRDELHALEGLQKRGLVREHAQTQAFFIDPADSIARLGKVLKMASPPRTIEGIDIAHLDGGELCGSVVVFIDGKPLKSEYRRFKIKTVAGNDDYASIREVVYRRYKYAGMNNELFPDVILIDGGKGQLSAAYSAFDDLEFTPPMLISLAKKNEEIHMLGLGDPICLSRRDTALRLLQSVRDESHRFAQNYHHILRKKAMLETDKPKSD